MSGRGPIRRKRRECFGLCSLLLEDVSGFDFTMWVVSADRPFEASEVVRWVPVNGPRGWPGRGDVSWQPMFQ